MRALMWHGGHDLRVVEVPTPKPGAGEVLVRVAACGVCGTDIHALDGGFPPYRPPRILGHEAAGVVEAVGDGVRQVTVGQHVAVEPSFPCDACVYCRDGQEQMCMDRRVITGGYAEYMCAPERSVVPLPDGIPLEVGGLAEPVGCCVHAIDVAGLRSGATAVVVGAGPIGLSLLQLARRSGAARVIVSEPDETRRRMAGEFGADLLIDPVRDDPVSAVKDFTGGLGADVAFEAVGRPELVGACLGLVRRCGQVIVVGVNAPGSKVSIDLYDLHEREISIKTAWGRSYSFRRAVAWLPQLTLRPMITHRFPLAAAAEALTPRPGRIKPIIEPWS